MIAKLSNKHEAVKDAPVEHDNEIPNVPVVAAEG
jgi:hypothetical protein